MAGTGFQSRVATVLKCRNFKGRDLALGVLLALAVAPMVFGAESGDVVALVYNRRLPASKKLADYYSQRRHVPAGQVFGFDLPIIETITRADFREQLQKPLLVALEKNGLLGFKADIKPAAADKPGEIIRSPNAAKIRYLALCYGVPLRILSDPNLAEPGADKVRPELRRNEAAVDSELALLPLIDRAHLFGPVHNPLYGATDGAWFQPTNGVLMVARLDGPTPEIARGLIDLAIQAETNGLWGRAYFDLRGLTNGDYKLGDDWIRGAAQAVRNAGFETIIDEKPETLPQSFPMSQIAIYAGWYDGAVSGPFTLPAVEFMPGAVAYHLHSFSAHTIWTTNQYWVGPLLAKGVTATMGCVDEPYLAGTPNISFFFQQLLKGFSFGEAAYACQESLSWQTTVVGDPLYRPFLKSPPQQHFDLQQRTNKLIEWSHLKIVNLNLIQNVPAKEASDYLEKESISKGSAVLQEKLGDLYTAQGKPMSATNAYGAALRLDPSPQQKIRLLFVLAEKDIALNRQKEAYDLYHRLLKEFPHYPDLAGVYLRLLPLAESLGKKKEAEKLQRDLNRLNPPPAKL
jgi:uncharacterized protein (TIGR03790 family)